MTYTPEPENHETPPGMFWCNKCGEDIPLKDFRKHD